MCMYPMSVLCLKRYQVPFDSSPMCCLFEKVLEIQKSFAHDVSRVIESYLYQHESLKIPGLGELWSKQSEFCDHSSPKRLRILNFHPMDMINKSR